MVKENIRRLLVATHNKGKVAEYAHLLDDRLIDWLTLDEAGIVHDVDETGSTFLENATLKAVAYAQGAGLLTLADDSGLEVDALDGEPGVMTARFGGTHLKPVERYTLLLDFLKGVPAEDRSARFRCAIVLASEDGRVLGSAEGVCEGIITFEPAGVAGFGYDPVFFIPEAGMTMAQLSAVEKHRISHRGRATRAIEPLLRRILNETGTAQ